MCGLHEAFISIAPERRVGIVFLAVPEDVRCNAGRIALRSEYTQSQRAVTFLLDVELDRLHLLLKLIWCPGIASIRLRIWIRVRLRGDRAHPFRDP